MAALPWGVCLSRLQAVDNRDLTWDGLVAAGQLGRGLDQSLQAALDRLPLLGRQRRKVRLLKPLQCRLNHEVPEGRVRVMLDHKVPAQRGGRLVGGDSVSRNRRLRGP